jgi:predicted enzyme related to lactoylglutathione lyase
MNWGPGKRTPPTTNGGRRRRSTLAVSRKKTWARPVVFFEIHAQDRERMADFYREMFEWNITPGVMPGFLAIENGIGAPPEGISGMIGPATHGSRVTIVIQVADLRDSLVQAEELGGKVLMQPIDVPQGPTVARISDPEGNVLTLVQQ